MMETTSTNGVPGTAIDAASQLCAQLRRAFGGDFSVWAKGATWQPAFPNREKSASPWRALSDDVQREFIERHFQAGELKAIPLDDERRLVVAPLDHCGSAPMAVCGVVGAAEAEIVPHFMATALLNAELQGKLAETTQTLNSYAGQVTVDFEELTWLRSLSEHLDLCGPANDTTTLAEAVLPSLRELIEAELLAYFPFAGPAAPTDSEPSARSAPSFRVGRHPLSDDGCRALIDHLKPRHDGQVVVRNVEHRDGSFAGFPGIRSCILMPVAKQNIQYGWLLAVNKKLPTDAATSDLVRAECLSDWEFGTFEAGLITAAAVMFAAHARNTELFREKEAMLIGVIRALINAIDAKDTYTCGHSDRVAQIARRLAEQLGFDAAECERVYMAGLLHDVGKIGVPDSVLTKPGRLTDEEFALIKKHPEIGHSILRHVAQLNYVLPAVLHHHESIDGRGYPHSLAGEQIPLSGRILAVADAYDAMTSTRPYRNAMPTEKAESILREGAGKQWDARVIEAFFAALAEIRDIRDTDPEQAPTSGEVPPTSAAAQPSDSIEPEATSLTAV